MTGVYDSLLLAEAMSPKICPLTLQYVYNAVLSYKRWGFVVSFTRHLDDDKWEGLQTTRIGRMHFLGGDGKQDPWELRGK